MEGDGPGYALTPEERATAYASRLAQLSSEYPSPRLPGQPAWAVVIAGVNGVGKSTAQRAVQSALRSTGIVSYDGDDNVKVHPRYEALRRAYPLEWFELTDAALDSDALRLACMDHLRDRDVLLSHPMAREEWARGWLNEFPDPGYRRTAVYVAAHPAWSTIGLGTRYQHGLDNDASTPWVDLELHDTFGAELPDTAQALESGKAVHDILVCDPDGYVWYENHLDASGDFKRAPASGQAIREVMAFPPTEAEHERVMRGVDGLLADRNPALPPIGPEVRELAQVARERQTGRPASQARPRDPARRLEVRLQAIHHSLGRPGEDLRNAHRAASAGIASAQAAPAGAAPSGPAQTGPAQAGPAQTGPAQAGPAQTGPAQAGPAQTGPAQAGGAEATGRTGADRGVTPDQGAAQARRATGDGRRGEPGNRPER
ncbi:zeta toxin family protein [Kribbella solani]|uniref:zeta toxin family protein n=1 Tax=Kribbella solani TaxID=236067 RepID=UPI0029AA639A|nr:zeta toxin family protein [Kribbella solani]MDX2972707.1 zeta toxin family protein [Kribbella solani]